MRAWSSNTRLILPIALIAIVFAGILASRAGATRVNAASSQQPVIPPEEGGPSVRPSPRTTPPAKAETRCRSSKRSHRARVRAIKRCKARAKAKAKKTAPKASTTPPASSGSGNVGSVGQTGSGSPAQPSSGVTGLVACAGVPAAGATIEASSGTPGQPSAALAAVTGADGSYVWSLAPGSWSITASAGGCRPATQTVTVSAGTVTRLDFKLDPA